MSESILDREALVNRILALTDYRNTVWGLGTPERNKLKVKPGMMVITGPQFRSSLERHLGFIVQIRLGRGQFGSDMVFVRHPDGMLVTHENQCFCQMSEDQEALARPLFTDLPEDEDLTRGYSCCDKVHEVGFFIQDSASKPMPDSPFAIITTSTPKNDGT